MKSSQHGIDATFSNHCPNQQQTSTSQYYDCNRLLTYACNAEADCMVCVNQIRRVRSGQHNDSDVGNPQVSFGHPEPPKLVMLELLPNVELSVDNVRSMDSSDYVIVVAYTKHTVSAQMIGTEKNQRYPYSSNKSTGGFCRPESPLEVCILVPEDGAGDAFTDFRDEEQISCLTIVRLDEIELLKTQFTSSGTLHANYNVHYNFDEEMDDSDGTEQHRLAVVFGTNHSRLYTVELKVTKKILNSSNFQDHQPQWNIARVSMTNNSSIQNSLFQVLPVGESPNDASDPGKSGITTFSPNGGIQGVWTFRVLDQQRNWNKDATTSVYLWVAFCDGRVVRLHSACLFPSIWKIGAENGESVEEFIHTRMAKRIDASVVNAILQLPLEVFEKISTIPQFVPLPQYHLSPLGAIPLSDLKNLGDNMYVDSEDIAVGESMPTIEVLVLAQGSPSDTFPTFCFYVSEDQYFSAETDVTRKPDTILSSQSSSVITTVSKALFGSAVGAFRWGFGTTSSSTGIPVDNNTQTNTTAPSRHGPSHDIDTTNNEETSDDGSERHCASTPFPSLLKEPVYLFAGMELHDAPRQIESCSVDPDGYLAAASDSLGRVLLIDLESKQVIRMWKGYRDSRCYWHHAIEPNKTHFSLHLVIHSQQRRLVEVWKVRHGCRVLSKQVGRDAAVVCCMTVLQSSAEIATCYVVHSLVPGSSQTYLEKIQWTHAQPVSPPFIQIADNKRQLLKSTLQRQSSDASFASVRSSTLKIQHLQQLLSSTTVAFSLEDLERSLLEIKSLTDLATALDLLATSSVLESQLGITDASFHVTAVLYCSEVLNKALKRLGEDPDSCFSSSSAYVRLLSLKIKYYSQIIQAYGVLTKFRGEHNDCETTYPQTSSPSQWMVEATGWASTYEQVTKSNLDKIGIALKENSGFVTFVQFASSCVFPSIDDVAGSKKHPTQIKIYFNESSRIRIGILEHIFRPLLFDVFAYTAVHSIFDSFGIRDDITYLQQCFSEWFFTLTIAEACTKGLYAENPPMKRFLLDLVRRDVESQSSSELRTILKEIHKRCEESTDLVRAFMLGSICHEAVITVVIKKEKLSYGKFSATRVTRDWTFLLRKLRICMLVTLRLHGIRLAAPVTISNVKQGLFSVFEWLAHDELQMTHDPVQIVSLEKACSLSSYAFDPSTQDGDGPARFRMLLNSCLSASITEEEREEYLVDFEDDDRFGALLLFFKNHNIPALLAAHRVLLLGSLWSSNPIETKPLHDSIFSLRSLHVTAGLEYLTSGVCLELWQSHICPIFRAHLFGFRDVQELSEDVVDPLINNRHWLCDIGRFTLQILAILKVSATTKVQNVIFDNLLIEKTTKTWPPVTEDSILKRLMEKVRPIEPSALDAHSVIVCAILISNDTEQLMQCVPSIDDCFIPQCLFHPIMTSSNVRDIQKTYLDNAIFDFARDFSKPVLDMFELGEIHTLAELWNFDLKSIHTLFMLAIYEYGKDRVVDELLTKASSKLVLHHFVENGVDIACRRLNFLLDGGRLYSSGKQDVLSLLDADTCEWIKRRAVESRSLVLHPDLSVPIASTHLFIMRLLSLSSGSNVDSALRPRIHSLVVLSGLLVKALASLR